MAKLSKTFDTSLEAALHWFSFGLKVIPLVPNSKQAAVKWNPWLETLSIETIQSHWSRNPSHELACIVGDGLIVFDTDSEAAERALSNIEMEHGCRPLFIVQTTRGHHHYFRRPSDAYAKSDSHDSSAHPDRIDVKTGRGMIVLPPSTGKVIKSCYAPNIGGLDEAHQAFIDDVFKHNGRQPPRPSRPYEPSTETADPTPVTEAKLATLNALLEHISPDMGYEDWLHVLMALFHETQGSEDGLSMAIQWSRDGRKYKGQREIEVKWRSFRQDIARPATISTLIKLVKEGGADIQAIMSSNQEAFSVCDYEVINPIPVPAKQDERPDTSPLTAFSLQGQLKALQDDLVEQKHILGKLVLQGQATVFYAAPNSGKTLLVLHLIIESIKRGILNAPQVFYVNMDDNSQGLVEKLQLAEEYGFHMLADNHQGLDVGRFRQAIEQMIADGTARGSIVVLDTLKKFTSLMDKVKSSEFARLVRQFSLKGGTVIALAHTNKNPDAAGRGVYSGTSDIVDDLDCAYVIDPVPQPDDPTHKVVEFRNIKRRGNVAQTAAYRYTLEPDARYEELLLSVQEIDPSQLTVAKQAAEVHSDAHIIESISLCIDDGIVSKMKLADAAAERARCAKRSALRIIEKYTGDDPAHHRWNFTVQERGAKVYHLLTPPSGPTEDPPPS